ncbi:MAG TPA: MlaD family protein [Thermoanaerobaculia bacterium]|nr:MlaD family protein [Thermoanaerobaculia bacterium]
MPRAHQLRVGLLVLGALVVLAVGIFLIGEQNRLFTSKNRYFITVRNVGGLNEGNPVRLNGVTVGLVEQIHLPKEIAEEELVIRISIEELYEERIRQDSVARIRTLGLLGDKYIDVTSGSPGTPVIPPGGQIPTAPQTDVDQLVASGEDMVENMVAISHSLRNVLDRVDRGEGLLGDLTADTEEGRAIKESVTASVASLERFAASLESGKGPLTRLLHDEVMAERLASSVDRLAAVLDDLEHGDGLLPSLIYDPAMREDAQATLAELRTTSEQVRRLTLEIEQDDGLLQRLLRDEELAERVARDLAGITHNLHQVSLKLNRGEGTAARLINDAQIYDAVNDILVGVDESPLLRWLIRNRQEKGIEKRYEQQRQPQERPEGADGGPAAPAEEPGPADEEQQPAAPGSPGS